MAKKPMNTRTHSHRHTHTVFTCPEDLTGQVELTAMPKSHSAKFKS